MSRGLLEETEYKAKPHFTQKPMFDILPLLQCLMFCVDATTLRRLSVVIHALLAMNGRVTLLGISRWAGKGGSYRTIQRFFNTVLPWPQMLWEVFRTHHWQRHHTYLLAGDEVVVTKAGKKHMDWIGSSLVCMIIPCLEWPSFAYRW